MFKVFFALLLCYWFIGGIIGLLGTELVMSMPPFDGVTIGVLFQIVVLSLGYAGLIMLWRWMVSNSYGLFHKEWWQSAAPQGLYNSLQFASLFAGISIGGSLTMSGVGILFWLGSVPTVYVFWTFWRVSYLEKNYG